MKTKLFFILLFLFSASKSFSQQKLRIIKANSLSVDIKDDDYPVRKNAWSIVPTEKLDVYATSAKKVTFYTDQESISFNVDPKVGGVQFYYPGKW